MKLQYKIHYTKEDLTNIRQCHAICNYSMRLSINELTTIYSTVTCKRCLKMLDKQNKQTLKSCQTAVEDLINKPKHYNIGKIQAINYITDKKLDFTDGNVVKYISRAKHKGTELSDRQKTIWYAIKGLILLVGKDKALNAVVQTIKHFEDDETNDKNMS